MDKIENNTSEILELFSNKFDKNEKFYHLLEQISKHTIKLAKLKENEDKPGHFNEEVADIYLLTHALLRLEHIEKQTVLESSDNFLSKIKEIYSQSD